jgi:hypothetical protein
LKFWRNIPKEFTKNITPLLPYLIRRHIRGGRGSGEMEI